MIFYFNRFRLLRQCRILLTRVSRTGRIYLLCSHRRTVRTQPEGQAYAIWVFEAKAAGKGR